MNKAQVSPKATMPKKRFKKAASLDKKKARAGWVFVLPFIIGFLLIYLPMIAESITATFYTVKTVAANPAAGVEAGYKFTFAGLKYYKAVLTDNSEFVQTLISGLTQLVIDIPAIIIFSLFMAVILNQKMFGRAVFRAIFFVPVIISTGIVAQVDNATAELSNQMSGETSIETGNQASGTSSSDLISAADISSLFSTMVVGSELVTYVVQIVNNIYSIVNRSGVQLLIFLAGLQSISPAIYESCSIDGATSWETFWKITFPMISPMILVNAIYTVIDSFTSQSNQVMTYINGQFISSGNSEATTMAWIYFVIVIAIVAVVALVLSSYIFYQRRDG